MKNETQPLQESVMMISFNRVSSSKKRVSLMLSPNEFTDKTDSFGLFQREYEPVTFLSLQEQ